MAGKSVSYANVSGPGKVRRPLPPIPNEDGAKDNTIPLLLPPEHSGQRPPRPPGRWIREPQMTKDSGKERYASAAKDNVSHGASERAQSVHGADVYEYGTVPTSRAALLDGTYVQQQVPLQQTFNLVSGLAMVGMKNSGGIIKEYMCIAYKGSDTLCCYEKDGTLNSEIYLPGVLNITGLLSISDPREGHPNCEILISNKDNKKLYLVRLIQKETSLSLWGLQAIELRCVPGTICWEEKYNTIDVTNVESKAVVVYSREELLKSFSYHGAIGTGPFILPSQGQPNTVREVTVPGNMKSVAQVVPFQDGYAALDSTSCEVVLFQRDGDPLSRKTLDFSTLNSTQQTYPWHIASGPGGALLITDRKNNSCYIVQTTSGNYYRVEWLWDEQDHKLRSPSCIHVDKDVLYVVGFDASTKNSQLWKCAYPLHQLPLPRDAEQISVVPLPEGPPVGQLSPFNDHDEIEQLYARKEEVEQLLQEKEREYEEMSFTTTELLCKIKIDTGYGKKKNKNRVKGVALLRNHVMITLDSLSSIWVYNLNGEKVRRLRLDELDQPNDMVALKRRHPVPEQDTLAISDTNNLIHLLTFNDRIEMLEPKAIELSYMPLSMSRYHLSRILVVGDDEHVHIYDSTGTELKCFPLLRPLGVGTALQLGRTLALLYCIKNGEVVWVDGRGEPWYQYDESQLSSPNHMVAEFGGRIILADTGARRILLLSADGKLVTIILQKSNDVLYPRRLCFDSGSGLLAIGQDNQDDSNPEVLLLKYACNEQETIYADADSVSRPYMNQMPMRTHVYMNKRR